MLVVNVPSAGCTRHCNNMAANYYVHDFHLESWYVRMGASEAHQLLSHTFTVDAYTSTSLCLEDVNT